MFLVPLISQDFYHEEVLNFVKGFSASNEMILCLFSFQFVYIVDYIDRFSYVEILLHFWDEANLVMVKNFSDMFLVCFDCMLLNIFASMLMSEISL